MPSAYATKVAEGFSAKLLKHIYEYAPIEALVNRDYQGDINVVGSKLNILQIAKISEKDYTGANLTADSLYETNTVLTISEKKSFYWAEKTIDKWVSYIKAPHSTVVAQKANERIKNIMAFLLGFWSDAASGQWYGTSYATGTVTITTGTGAVVGSGTAFTSGMVGKPFKATGHSKWYRVKTFTDGTNIVIENDSDDETSAYDGGAIGSGAAYEIQANTAKTVDNGGSNPTFLTMVLELGRMLDDAEVPSEDRVLFVPPVAQVTMLKDAGIKLNVPAAYDEMVKQGMITMLNGFKVIQSSRVAGDNTNGFHLVAAHKSWLTFADKTLESGMEEDLPGELRFCLQRPLRLRSEGRRRSPQVCRPRLRQVRVDRVLTLSLPFGAGKSARSAPIHKSTLTCTASRS